MSSQRRWCTVHQARGLKGTKWAPHRSKGGQVAKGIWLLCNDAQEAFIRTFLGAAAAGLSLPLKSGCPPGLPLAPLVMNLGASAVDAADRFCY